ncbi:hypothetical protein I4U23_021540 [Adineta vaga]|nr:hypothetical protein I4U23_021540 [Adineta vaga]
MPQIDDSEKPVHMIFWLDQAFRNPNRYLRIKEAFGSNTDPRCETWTILNEFDYNLALTDSDVEKMLALDGGQFFLRTFSTTEECLDAFKDNQDKRIFFITSGSMGRHIVPLIMKQYRHVFTDQITNDPYSSVYVYCCSIENQIAWALTYSDYIQIFNFDQTLLRRLIRDIAEYYIVSGKRAYQYQELKRALQLLHWAKRLWKRYSELSNRYRSSYQNIRESQINKLIEEIESERREESGDDDAACVESCD